MAQSTERSITFDVFSSNSTKFSVITDNCVQNLPYKFHTNIERLKMCSLNTFYVFDLLKQEKKI